MGLGKVHKLFTTFRSSPSRKIDAVHHYTLRSLLAEELTPSLQVSHKIAKIAMLLGSSLTAGQTPWKAWDFGEQEGLAATVTSASFGRRCLLNGVEVGGGGFAWNLDSLRER